MSKFMVRPAEAADFIALKPMLLDMGFVEDETALEARFPEYCTRPDYGFLVAETKSGELYGITLIPIHVGKPADMDFHRRNPVFSYSRSARVRLRLTLSSY